MRNQDKAPTGAKNGTNGYVILLSPGRRCWKCERLVPSDPSAVLLESNFEGELRQHLFVTCSEDCAARVRKELSQAGRNPEKIDISKASFLLHLAQTQLVAVIESWRCDYHYGAMVYRGVPALERMTAFFAVLN
jgi:hypothetical protein